MNEIFNDDNQISSAFVAWGKVDDYFVGTLTDKSRESDDKYNPGEKQKLYDFKMKEGKFHTMDEKNNPVEEATVINAGEDYTVGGRKALDAQLRNIKVGTIIGMKFVEEIPPKDKGNYPTKSIKVFTTGQIDPDFMEGAGKEVSTDEA